MAPVLTVQVGSTCASVGAVGTGGTAPIVTVELVELQPRQHFGVQRAVCVEPATRPV